MEKLRQESATHRTAATAATTRADTIAAAYATALVAATARLADPTDVPYDTAWLGEDGIPDPEKINAAIDELLARKPHLADRRPTGHVDQGARPSADAYSLAAALRAGAG